MNSMESPSILSVFVTGTVMMQLLLVGRLCLSIDPSSDMAALLSIKRGIRDEFVQLGDWLAEAKSPCQWTGIGCNNQGRVVCLDLRGRNLSGILSDEIGLLDELRFLDVSHNSFSQGLPTGIANLSNLITIDLSSNSFAGSFPACLIANLTSLEYIAASDNSFSGPLPRELGKLLALQVIDLSGSYFEGGFPVEYTSFTKLKWLRLASNALNGSLPQELGNLTELTRLEIGYNAYEGQMPREIGQLRKLQYLDISASNLSGAIPVELGRLSSCNTVFLFRNRLWGDIPPELGNMTSLNSIDFSENNLTGAIPSSFSQLRKLTLLSLMFNRLSGSLPAFLADLSQLQTLKIFNNFFTGSLPSQLGRFPSLQWLDASTNLLSGAIPDGICNGGGLVKMELFGNELSGAIPDLRNCRSLIRIRLQKNQLSGHIHQRWGSLCNLTRLELARNSLTGEIPASLGDATLLSFIDLSLNRLTGSVPASVWAHPRLQELHASGNCLSGTISSAIANATFLSVLDLSNNSIGGPIPPSIQNCQKLVSLNLALNNLCGLFPISLGRLPSLAILDLSQNHLTGPIPPIFQNSRNLDAINVSFNNLSGPIPMAGIFKTSSISCFIGNAFLCGGDLQPCPISETTMASNSFALSAQDQSRKKLPSSLACLVGGILALTLLILIIASRWFYKQYKDHICANDNNNNNPQGECHWKLTYFQSKLNFTCYDVLDCLKDSNIVGKGGAGTVYKAEMACGEIVAVKKLRKRNYCKGLSAHFSKDGGFLAEIHVLGKIRHRNVVRLLGFCSNDAIAMNLLLYEFVPNGSLADLLHGSGMAVADWVVRYNIAVGVAQGLCYLHHDCYPQIVHRDVKSSNILLDANLEARVADFGVAKLIEVNESMSIVAGSYGYIAPEYAYTMKVSEKSDIYSFGVVLLELLTRRQPVEPEFGDAINIVEWVQAKIQNNDDHAFVFDSSIGSSCMSVREEMMLVLRIALLCTSSVPKDRPSMRDVVKMLSEAKPRRKSILEKQSPTSKFSK
ncbi:hypothetical protein O6H91_07G116800 [Diphasiastrum complanatum]|uniref:Uncharacterized protein n=1 Tax=Diphasiastrum complanatum TaxID=34168 RepID=A0ACC2D9Z9_DIPCM|nr:hypothetical protein O6H91_07G116800 [Diphasiastrum complanatum]